MADPVITIATCVYNGRSFIASYANNMARLREVLNLQLLIIDDGSNDDTLKLLIEYLPWATICVQENKGLPASRNRILNIVTTPYILFLDIDDELKIPAFLQNLALMQNKRSIKMLYSSPIYFDGQNGIKIKLFNFVKYLITLSPTRNTIYKRNFYVTLGNVIFRTDFIKRHDLKFNENLTIGEDWAFLLLCSKYEKSKFCFKPFLKYRLNLVSMSSTEMINEEKFQLLYHELKSHVDHRHEALFENSWRVNKELQQFSKTVKNVDLQEVIKLHTSMFLRNPNHPYILLSMVKNIIKKIS